MSHIAGGVFVIPKTLRIFPRKQLTISYTLHPKRKKVISYTL